MQLFLVDLCSLRGEINAIILQALNHASTQILCGHQTLLNGISRRGFGFTLDELVSGHHCRHMAIYIMHFSLKFMQKSPRAYAAQTQRASERRCQQSDLRLCAFLLSRVNSDNRDNETAIKALFIIFPTARPDSAALAALFKSVRSVSELKFFLLFSSYSTS